MLAMSSMHQNCPVPVTTRKRHLVAPAASCVGAPLCHGDDLKLKGRMSHVRSVTLDGTETLRTNWIPQLPGIGSASLPIGAAMCDSRFYVFCLFSVIIGCWVFLELPVELHYTYTLVQLPVFFSIISFHVTGCSTA